MWCKRSTDSKIRVIAIINVYYDSCQNGLVQPDLYFVILQEALDDATHPWGIKVERVEIKDVKLPQQLQRAMAAEAEASREARAKVSAGREDSMTQRKNVFTHDCLCFRLLLLRVR